VGFLRTSGQPSQRLLPNNTQRPQQRDIHASGGIRTHNPCKGVDVDPRLRPHRYCIGSSTNKVAIFLTLFAVTASNFGQIITLNLRQFLLLTFEIFSRGIIFLKKSFLFLLPTRSTIHLEFSAYIKIVSS